MRVTILLRLMILISILWILDSNFNRIELMNMFIYSF